MTKAGEKNKLKRLGFVCMGARLTHFLKTYASLLGLELRDIHL